MRLLLSGLLVLLVCGSTSQACLWIDGTTLEGKFISVGRSGPPMVAVPLPEVPLWTSQFFRAGNHAEFLRVIAAMPPEEVLESSTESPRDLPGDWPPTLSDAVRPIFTGDFGKAAEMLVALDREYPNNYFVCANLGVTSELAGKNAEALQWVEKAMQLKPGAHFGTEWMHAAVLRAKLAMAKDPAWLEKHTISGIPLGDVPAGFSLSEEGRHVELPEIQSALLAHLIPRLLLVKGEDRIVAAMLTELARVEARNVSVEAGIDMLMLAAEHGAANTAPTLKEWEARVTHRKFWYWWKTRNGPPLPLIWGVMGIAAFYVWRIRRWRRAKQAAVQP